MIMKLKKIIYTVTLGLTAAAFTTSCEDMLDKGNDYVIYADDHMITDPADTVTSVLGILNKLQAIAVRTNLLGEVRADLVVVNENATTDLKDLAAFNANVTSDEDANVYNVPRDYYAVINNCNYFIANADSTAGNTNRNEKYFRTEIAQVHSIRAWTYLQLVLAYGRVPLVTDPVVTKLQSDATYPMVELEDICDYFISDLKPYYGREYPDYGNIGGDIDPQMCFFPTQVVMGDLYLWKAVAMGKGAGQDAAKQAAKSYYDYIMWDLSAKVKTTTNTSSVSWDESSLYNGRYSHPNGNLNYRTTGSWGAQGTEYISAIPMDSAAADGYYNELRKLYNTTTTDDDYSEACISPSQSIKDLSQKLPYVGRDTYGNTVSVGIENFTDEEIDKGYYGDLRYQENYTTNDFKWNGKEVDRQSISKHQQQHIGIYRTSQLYLKLAEALNYAGYPRFARQILTMGLSNTVISSEVSPYYQSANDSSFIAYFDFNTTDFVAYAEAYTDVTDSLGVAVLSTSPVLRASVADCNMWGVHSRGSGLSFLNEDYCTLLTPDSTNFPYDYAEAVGVMPTKDDYDYPEEPKRPTEARKPSTWDTYGNVTVTREQYDELNSWSTTNRYNNYVNRDSVGMYNTYLTETLPQYEADLAAYNAAVAELDAQFATDSLAYEVRLSEYAEQYKAWHAEAYADASLIEAEQAIVDQAILEEQALELIYEGNRFFDLMRRCYWYNDNSILVDAVSKRDAAAGAKLATRSNWFLNWKDKIGY